MKHEIPGEQSRPRAGRWGFGAGDVCVANHKIGDCACPFV
jgi:hypothetical protein